MPSKISEKGPHKTIIVELAMADLVLALMGIFGASLHLAYNTTASTDNDLLSDRDCHIFDTLCQVRAFVGMWMLGSCLYMDISTRSSLLHGDSLHSFYLASQADASIQHSGMAGASFMHTSNAATWKLGYDHDCTCTCFMRLKDKEVHGRVWFLSAPCL